MNLKLKTTALIGALITAVLTAVLAAATAAPATAARPPVVDLHGDGFGSYTLNSAGTALLSGAVSGKPFGGDYSATLASSDGTLPAPGTCEPATATMQVTGSKNRFLHLAATGEVCGTWADATYVVTPQVRGPVRRDRCVRTEAARHRRLDLGDPRHRGVGQRRGHRHLRLPVDGASADRPQPGFRQAVAAAAP